MEGGRARLEAGAAGQRGSGRLVTTGAAVDGSAHPRVGRGGWRAAPKHTPAGADVSIASARQAPGRFVDGRGRLARLHWLANGRHTVQDVPAAERAATRPRQLAAARDPAGSREQGRAARGRRSSARNRSAG
ncbi:hypothetical protein [Paenibacillus radicis (ex Xue et al. 2023)]|uniref:Uncharacterized protein n=1 Tax=Paenibacillus radicis (ex Xue et al. 2023) TaxID=2972489 RepID=A0ABT1YSB4_9BACL|nr:hypothetical protein [Paenibacillus radicis (ex Xue et al. 2023)]MCR8636069.1 hypothetical protein [Paenibacillus radicis (ex Xue et al. 2023)]